MLKKLVLGGAAVSAFAGLGLVTPALADTPWPGNENNINVSKQSDNVTVCGNKAIGDITVVLLNLNPVTSADREPVDCSIKAVQNNN
ncbi:hypothetical protein HNP84_009152 [Thermocatellispora tengchongensis]|uniref:Secreted protein n=1 Tax=Thermocatellispora tengchongensis TaxID=1073253 RepID=A0A840PKB1_9ACTN|nr:hypothetical protein [Thermocatellispora tengchongensis]MBB5139389.1 hypothetical protein [Thermocatellispora tengchongensis]